VQYTTSTSTVTVTQPSASSITATVNLRQARTVTATVTVSQGSTVVSTQRYTYLNPTTTHTFVFGGLAAGTYTVTVTGGAYSSPQTVTVPPDAQVTFSGI
jgi:hypothetical protein